MLGKLLFFAFLSTCWCQYGSVPAYSNQQAQYYERPPQEYQEESNKRPPAQILSHKQALSHDGNFKYAFASENGLLQGESISPDGSRTGAYEYIDPHGKKISVKYVAGKEGFRVLEGAHIPRPPPHPQVAPHPGYGIEGQGQHRPASPPQVPRPHYAEERAGYQQQQPKPIYTFTGAGGPQLYEKPRYLDRTYVPERRENEIFQNANGAYKPRNKDEEYPDIEPGKPNSFGTGYSFEFGRN